MDPHMFDGCLPALIIGLLLMLLLGIGIGLGVAWLV